MPIEVKSLSDISTTPYSLPTGYYWDNLNLADDTVANELY